MSQFGAKFDSMQRAYDNMAPGDDEQERDPRVYRVTASFEFTVDIPGLELSEHIEKYLLDHASEIFASGKPHLADWEEVEVEVEVDE